MFVATFLLYGVRVSMDLVMNTRGRKLLDALACTNMTILNGNILGDIHGKHTCHLYNGSSVVDYIIATENIKERVCNLIIDLNSFSDHCPFYLKLDCSIATSNLITARTFQKAPKRFKWNTNCDPVGFTLGQSVAEIPWEIEQICNQNCQCGEDVHRCNDMLVYTTNLRLRT